MIYLVFSFDDGLLDFKENALPILRKYGFRATVNVISGFVDNSIVTDFSYLSVKDIVFLNRNGFEIANHTNSHMKHASFEELLDCNSKINEWCNEDMVRGVAMPKYAKPSESAYRYIKLYKPPYITYQVSKYPVFLNLIRRIIYKIKFLKRKTTLSKYQYNNQIMMYKRNSTFFYRVEVGINVDPEILFQSLESVKNNYCITLCLHSIADDVSKTDYPKGAWTPEQFDLFCNLVKQNNQIKVVTQLEACSPMSRKVKK